MRQLAAAQVVSAIHAIYAAHVVPLVSRVGAMVAPPPAGGARAPDHLVGPAQGDPLVIGIALVAIGVLWALGMLAMVVLLHRPRRLKWPVAARHTSGAHAVVPATTHSPISGGAGSSTAAAHEGGAHLANALLDARVRSISPDDTAWRPVEYEVPEVGMVHLDARTVRAFAGRPDVLRRLAFQRWRYQAGRCSEFASECATPGGASREALRSAPAEPRKDGPGDLETQGDRRGPSSAGRARKAARRAGAHPFWRPGRGAPVSHPAGQQ